MSNENLRNILKKMIDDSNTNTEEYFECLNGTNIVYKLTESDILDMLADLCGNMSVKEAREIIDIEQISNMISSFVYDEIREQLFQNDLIEEEE
jgi:hypothetical protein